MKKRHDQATDKFRLSLPLLALMMAFAFIAPQSTAYAATAANEQEAAQAALKQNGGTGKVLGVSSTEDSNGQPVFEVKVLSNGRVRVIRIMQKP